MVDAWASSGRSRTTYGRNPPLTDPIERSNGGGAASTASSRSRNSRRSASAPRAVCHRVSSGRLRRLHHGIYGIGPPTDRGCWLAAVLACGDGAVLSHRSAAALWGLTDRHPRQVEVTSPARTGRSRPGVHARQGRLDRSETATRDGIPCTTVPRTLLDLAAVVDARVLERAVDRAELLRLFDLDAVRLTIARHRGRRGSRALSDVLAAYSGPTLTRSGAEERFLAFLRSTALPRPEVNAAIAVEDGVVYRPDFVWRDAGLIVEIDGRTYHARRRAFDHDRRRDRRLALAGFETRRYAARELMSDPDRVMAEIAAFLRLARPR